MKRTLRNWIASIALAATPGSAFAHDLPDSKYLAPVALEARCQVADGVLGSWTQLIALGADPLHTAILLADTEEPSPFDTEFASDEIAVAAATPAAKQCEPFCPFADIAADEPIDVVMHPNDLPPAPRHPLDLPAESKISPLVGSAPTIATLEEEYLPYDLVAGAPATLEMLPIRTPRVCKLSDAPKKSSVVHQVDSSLLPIDWSVMVAQPAAEQLAGQPAKQSAEVEQQATEQPYIPVACYVDSAINYAYDLLDPQGPIMPWIDARRIGMEMIPAANTVVQQAIEWTRPVWPILATEIATEAQPADAAPAPQNIAPAPVRPESELKVAAEALHTAANELERIANKLRTWGDSLVR